MNSVESSRPLVRVVRSILYRRLLLPALVLTIGGFAAGAIMRQHVVEAEQRRFTEWAAVWLRGYAEHLDRILGYVAAAGGDRSRFEAIASSLVGDEIEAIVLLDRDLRATHGWPDSRSAETVGRTDYSGLLAGVPIGEEGALSAPYFGSDGQIVVAAVRENLAGDGVILAELRLARLQRYIDSTTNGIDGTSRVVSVTDRFGNILAHPNRVLVEQQVNIGTHPVVREARDGGSAAAVVRRDGRWVLATGTLEETGSWIVLVEESLWTAYRGLAIVSVVAVVVSVLAIFLVVIRVEKRLEVSIVAPLSDFASRVGEAGEHRELETAGRTDAFFELQTLATNFSQLVHRVQGREASLRSRAREKEILLREIHHRVRNSLNVVASLLSLQRDRLQSVEHARVALDDSIGRIDSIARVHASLSEFDNLSSVDMVSYLSDLLHDLLSSLGTHGRISVTQDVDQIQLDIERAVPCGLLINELVTNAFRHAFPGDRSGRVEVSLHRAPGGDVLLNVSDDGVGFDPAAHSNRRGSLGLELVSILVEQLSATIDFGAVQGTTVVVRIPAASG